MSLKAGQKAPDFTLPESEWKKVSLSDFKGEKNVVLYFYPKDDTPGCTKEACDFRDNAGKLAKADTVVLGISKDSLRSHSKFKEKYELPFTLLADTDGEVIEANGCWVEKSMFAKKYMGIQRATFLIDKEGVIREIWPNVKVSGHVDEVLATLQNL